MGRNSYPTTSGEVGKMASGKRKDDLRSGDAHMRA